MSATPRRRPAPGARVVPPTSLTPVQLAAYKNGRRVSVCLPARNEETTVGRIAAAIRAGLMEPAEPGGPGATGGADRTRSGRPLGSPTALVDELLVMDDGSVDGTARVAAAAGAQVIRVADVRPDRPAGRGKGNALWRSVAASSGEVIVWCDADLTSFTPSYVTRLVAPLLLDPGTLLVKGFYERPDDGSGVGGGRTTELVARPLLSLFFPELATIRQPLGGEYAIARSLAERLAFVEGYGVEVGLLIDAFGTVGLEALAQVDLGVRTHRHHPLTHLATQAAEIIAVILARAGVDLPDPLPPLLGADGTRRAILVAEQEPLQPPEW